MNRMAKQNEPFGVIEAESFYDEAEKKVRVRPCPDGIYPTTLHVKCPRGQHTVYFTQSRPEIF